MNILEAYISQMDYFNVVFTSIDYELLKKIVFNLAKDFDAEFIDIYSIMTNIKDLDTDRLKEMTSSLAKVKFLIAPIFPSIKKKNETFTSNIDNKSPVFTSIFKFKVSYHINLSLNKFLIEKNKIRNELVNLEAKYKEDWMMAKYINVAKYKDNTNLLEDDIFNLIIGKIQKKLDNGKYEEKINNKNDNSSGVPVMSKSSRHASEYDHDKKEEYLDKINEKIDNDIYAEVDDSVYEGIVDDTVVTDDVNMDDELSDTEDDEYKLVSVPSSVTTNSESLYNTDTEKDPYYIFNKSEITDEQLTLSKDFSDLSTLEVYNQVHEGGQDKAIGTRTLRKEYGISGTRNLNKKLK